MSVSTLEQEIVRRKHKSGHYTTTVKGTGKAQRVDEETKEKTFEKASGSKIRCTCGYIAKWTEGEADDNHECFVGILDPDGPDLEYLYDTLYEMSTSFPIKLRIELHKAVEFEKLTYVDTFEYCFADKHCFLGPENAPIKLMVRYINTCTKEEDYKPVNVRPENIKSIEALKGVYLNDR